VRVDARSPLVFVDVGGSSHQRIDCCCTRQAGSVQCETRLLSSASRSDDVVVHLVSYRSLPVRGRKRNAGHVRGRGRNDGPY
jgi:hypothetical protein